MNTDDLIGWLPVLAAAVLGLAIGSFLNVVIHRVPREQSVVSPPSHCPGCETPIKGRHNIPVLSWLVLGGRCASCRSPISIRYPLVELLTAALFVAVVLRFGVSAQVPAYLYLAGVAVSLTMIDLDLRRLPDSIVLPSYVVASALLLPAGAVTGDWHSTLRALVGAVVAGLLVFTLALTAPFAVVPGHAKLAGLLGLYLGWLSWTSLLAGGVLVLVVVVAIGLASGVPGSPDPAPVPTGTAVAAARPTTVPVGAALTAGAVLVVLAAAPLLAWSGSLLA